MKKVIYPGTFDPITLGHFDIIKRSSETFDTVVIGVTDDNNKNNLFSIDERIDMIEKTTLNISNIEIA